MSGRWTGVGAFLIALIGLFLWLWLVPAPWHLVGLVAGFGVHYAIHFHNERVLKTIGAEADEWLVSVTYRSDGGHDALDFGRDVGFLTVVDGWLHFRGLRSDWSISRNDGFAVRDRVFVRLSGGDLVLRVRGREVKDSSIRTLLSGWSYGERVEGESRLPRLPVSRKHPWWRASDAAYPIIVTLFAVGLQRWVPSFFNGVPFDPFVFFLSLLFFLIVCGGPFYSAIMFMKTRRARWRSWQAAPPEVSRPGLPSPTAAPPSRNRNPRPADIVIR